MPTFSIKNIKEIWEHAGFQKYFKNTSWMLLGKFFTLGVSFIVGIYIARYLGPSNYGLFNYVISFVGLFAFLVSFGIDGIVSREIIKDYNKKEEIISTGFYIKIIGSLIAIISIFIISSFTTNNLFTLGLIWIYSLNFIPQSFSIIEIYFQSQILSKKVVTAQIISSIISTILKITIMLLDKGIFWLTLIYIVETTIYGLILLFSFRKFGNYINKWRPNINLAKLLLKDSWPLMLTAVAVSIYTKIDQVMIKNMLGDEQTGIYAVVAKLSEVWYVFPSIICVSIFPAIVNTVSTSKEILENRMKKLYLLMFWTSFPLAIVTTILSYPIIKILYGYAYIDAVIPLRIYIWAGISVFLGAASGQYLLAHNLTKISFYTTLIGAITNVILNIIFIPIIGITGAAIATLISYTISTFGIFIFRESREQGLLIFKSIFNYKN